jgi:hypothetical protein
LTPATSALSAPPWLCTCAGGRRLRSSHSARMAIRAPDAPSNQRVAGVRGTCRLCACRLSACKHAAVADAGWHGEYGSAALRGAARAMPPQCTDLRAAHLGTDVELREHARQQRRVRHLAAASYVPQHRTRPHILGGRGATNRIGHRKIAVHSCAKLLCKTAVRNRPPGGHTSVKLKSASSGDPGCSFWKT